MAMRLDQLPTDELGRWKLTFIRPDDWHLHLRDGAAMAAVLPDTAARFGRAIVMPNLKPPIVDTAGACLYRERILLVRPRTSTSQPLMTLYLTDNTPPEEIDEAVKSGIIHGVKLYPAGATTHSDAGVTSIEKTYPTLERMQELGMPLLVHGEQLRSPDGSEVDVFDRERVFIDQTLSPLVKRFPGLRIVLEHVTTLEGIQFVESSGSNIAATITAHHLLLNRNALFAGGARPHHYCLPVLKREIHRQALLRAATSGNPKFFLGTDSAPHARNTKEAACGCAGCYTAHSAIELYAEAFEEAGALDQLEGFASFFGADFYGLPRNPDAITLIREDWMMPASLPFAGNDVLVPFRAGEKVRWKLKAD